MKCPGQDPRFWKFDAIFDAKCPGCGAVVEFFKDETRRRCKKCGHQVLNPNMDFGCAAHCKFAEQCFGELPPELIKQKKEVFKDRVAVETKLALKTDFRRIGHASRMAKYAEKLVATEGGDAGVVLTAAYLSQVAQAREQAPNGGIKVVREIMSRLDAADELIDSVCALIQGEDVAGDNQKALRDADILATIEEALKRKDELIPDSGLITETGKKIAGELRAGA